MRPYEVVHSLRAPAVGFRVRAGATVLVYNPDVISIVKQRAVLSGVDVYVGDGASLTRPIVRHRGKAMFGHTTVRAQLGWCNEYGIARAYIVHCGKQLVQMDRALLQERIEYLAGPRLRAIVAHDGMRVRFPVKPALRKAC